MRVLSVLTFLGIAILCCEARRICKRVEPTKCVQNAMCIKGAHWDQQQCKCVTGPIVIVDPPPKPVCPANEVYSQCNAGCQTDCSGLLKPCAKICRAGCVCAPGYTRDQNNKNVCVKKCPQPTVCKAGEVESPCNGHCQATCDKPNPICTRNCVKGCVCPAGQIRDAAGKCILKTKCPATVTPGKCKANESWAPCPSGCSACRFFTSKMIACDPSPICTPGCACVPGYRKDNAGLCVKETECPGYTAKTTTVKTLIPNVCPANQVWSQCGRNICQGCGVNPLVCKPACQAPGCACADGYRRNSADQCVLPAQCPGSTPVCPANEVYSKCGANCQRDCYGLPKPCANICTAGCVCSPGFTRNEKDGGKCVQKCPPLSVCKAGEVESQCNGHCQATCDKPNPICTKNCVKGCVCPAGQIRDAAGKCILKAKCPATVTPGTCKANEYWAPCPSGCSACRFFTNKRIACDPARTCTPGCACVAGYRKDNAGLCVKETECPGYISVCKAGEVESQCNGHCQATCANPNPICTLQCVKGCVCPAGQLRDAAGKCVSKTNCPTTVTPDPKACPKNQIWSQCGMNGCQSCGVDPTVCKPGCFAPGCTCADGYKHNGSGSCVLPAQCPAVTPDPNQCPANEFWGDCGHNSCENCLVFLQQAACRPSCQPGCQCLAGYRRNDAGVCIPESQCQAATPAPPACPANEVYSKCNAGCQNDCSGFLKPCAKICRAGCVCAPGYTRDQNNKNVCVKKCPTVCVQNAACIKGASWDSKACKCVTDVVVPACKKNESLMCFNGCPEQTCTPNKARCLGPPIGPDCTKTCQCNSGYVRHNGVCVLQSKCPKVPACTGANQVYSTCINSCMTCDVITNRHPCDPLPPPDCSAGCTCADGYRTDGSGVCIPTELCPRGTPFDMVSMAAA